MTHRRPVAPPGTDRAARLGAALRANLARRKSQARHRAGDADRGPTDEAGDEAKLTAHKAEQQSPADDDSRGLADKSEG